MQKELQTRVSRLLENAEQSAQQGKREKAYRTSLKVTILAPDEPLGWYLRSQTAPSQEEQLVCLSRVYSLNPDFPPAKGKMHAALQGLIKQEPSLAYVDETKELYQVKSGLDLLLNVPKNRSSDELFLQKIDGPLKAAFIWLNLSLFTLFLGGVGAFFLAPMIVIRALLLQRHIHHHRDRVRVLIILALSAIIWLASIPLGLLFLIHFMTWGG
jgi:hypothetical protein